jgi:hypothetical protein
MHMGKPLLCECVSLGAIEDSYEDINDYDEIE